MNSLIEQKRGEMEQACRRRHVRRMELFGSAATGAFDPARSDLDFLVAFEDLAAGELSDAYFGLLEDLQGLFERPVDLVVETTFQNPYFRQSVESTKTLVYAG